MKKLLKSNKNSILPAVVLVCALIIAACSKEQPQAPVPAPSQSPKTAAVLPKPVQNQASSALRISPPPVNQFDFSNKKDPFKSFVVVKAEPKKSPVWGKNNLHSSLPIHSFDISQFKLIGIITGGRENKAMVTDPGGKGYVLKVGMLIGKNDGCLLYTSPSPRDGLLSRMPSSA